MEGRSAKVILKIPPRAVVMSAPWRSDIGKLKTTHTTVEVLESFILSDDKSN
jgi:hypothetical protein